jgi:hypothetical protein
MDMNEQSQHSLRHNCLGWIALLSLAAVLSPVSIHVVIAQDAPQFVVAPADPGDPPAPPPAPATPSEVNSEAEIGQLLPNDQAVTEPAGGGQLPADPDSVRTLSVEPGVRPMLPADRPAWVGAPPDYATPQHYLYVGSLPTTDERDADEALDEPLIAAVRNYIDQEVVNEPGAAFRMPVDAAFIRRNLIDDPSGYVCELATSQGSMFQKWVTVRVTPEQRELFANWHTQAVQRARLAPLGIGLVAVLTLVSLVHMALGRHGASPLPSINQHAPEPAVAVRRSWSWTALKVLGFLAFMMLPAFLVLAAVGYKVRTSRVVEGHLSGSLGSYEVPMPDLHKQVRIETLGAERTIVIESKSRR